MDRQQARDLMSEYLDGELLPHEQAAFEKQLAQDEVLRDELEALRNTLSIISGLPKESPSDDFLQKVRGKLKRQRKSVLDLSFGMDRKIPFEAISMILIGILLTLYFLLVALPWDRADLDSQGPGAIHQDGGVDAGMEDPAVPDMERQGSLPRDADETKPAKALTLFPVPLEGTTPREPRRARPESSNRPD